MNAMVPMYGFGGGGKNTSELNFDVKAYSTEEEMLASNPGENTIGIVTDTPITSYAITSSEPESAQEGMVWIITSIESFAEFNILSKNVVQVFPIFIKQYLSDEWINKNGMVYKNGAWIEFIHSKISISYPAGSNCYIKYGDKQYNAPDNTGIWNFIANTLGIYDIIIDDRGWYESVEVSEYGKEININLNKFYLYKNGVLKNDFNTNYPSHSSNWKIDDNNELTGYTGGGTWFALVISFDGPLKNIDTISITGRLLSYTGSYNYIYVSRYKTWSTSFDNRLATVAVPITAYNQTYTLDVSKINGEYYLWLAFQANNGAAKMIISEIVLS